MKITISNKVATKYLHMFKDSLNRITNEISVETDLDKFDIKKKLYSVTPGMTEITIEINDDFILKMGDIGAKYIPMLLGMLRNMYDIAVMAGDDIDKIVEEFCNDENTSSDMEKSEQ